MRNLIYPLVFLFFASSCGNDNHTVVPNGEPKDLHLPTKAKPDPILFYKAQGNEPGWNMVVMSTEEGSFPTTLVTAFGADTLTGFVNRMPIMKETKDGKGHPLVKSNEMKYSGQLNHKGMMKSVLVSIVSESCSDDADKKFPTSCVIVAGNEKLIGCGVYLE